MEIDFNIPLGKEDLLDSSTDGYTVKEVLQPYCLDGKLLEANSDMKCQGVLAITRHFDVFYSILHHFNRLKNEIKESAWGMLLPNLISHVATLPMVLSPNNKDNSTRLQHLCALKMECYLVCQFINAFEADAVKPDINLNKKGKNKKKLTEEWDWTAERYEALQTINQLVQLDLFRLWEPPVVEENFTNVLSNTIYQLLENGSFVRQKEQRDCVFHTLGHLVKRYKHQQTASQKIAELLLNFDNLVFPLSQAVVLLVTEFGAKVIVCDVFREIGRMVDAMDLSRDTSGLRSFSQFLVEITAKIPSVVLTNTSMLMAHLNGESYIMRNGVLGALGEIVANVLCGDELDDKMKKSRDDFLVRLQEHVHDKNAFVRSKVLQIWLHLCSEKVIPISRQSAIVDMAIGRLRDKSSQVRKYAIQFLRSSLVCNPYAAKLPIEKLTSSLEKELNKLKNMQAELADETELADEAELADEEVNESEPEEWLKIKDELRNAIEEFIDNVEEQEDDEMEIYEDDDDGLDKALLRVQAFLRSQEYRKALIMLHQILDIWSDCEDFEVSEDDMKKMEDENEKTLTENDCTPDEDTLEKQRVHRMKLKYCALMKKILLADADTANDKMEVDLAEVATQQDNQGASESVQPENVVFEQQRVLVAYLNDCLKFAKQMAEVIQILCKLFASKAISDVLETIIFFVTAHEFGLSQSEEGIRRMTALVWSHDQTIKKAAVSAFERLYVNISSDNETSKPKVIVKSLMSLIQNANLGELSSIEKLLIELMRADEIPQAVVQLLWQLFSLKIPQSTVTEQRYAVTLLAMLGGAKKEVIQSNIDVLVKFGLVKKDGYFLARDTCKAILKLTEKSRGNNKETLRFSSDHALFQTLETLLVDGVGETTTQTWIPFCEQAIAVVYKLAEGADVICGRILKRLVRAATGGDVEGVFASKCSIHSLVLARVLCAAGHTAMLQLYHLDVSILTELKRRCRLREDEQEKTGKRKERKKTTRRSSQDTSLKSASESVFDDDEMGVTGAVAEDEESEYIAKVCENELVTGPNLLSTFCPIAVKICSNPTKYNDLILQSAASLSLSKFMLVSSKFCDVNLQLFFTILEKSTFQTVRCNLMIMSGDLTFRFPNLIAPWAPRLYARLRDDSSEVRTTAINILTHLILNDMVKVKGQISEMAVCMQDGNEKIAASAKKFFYDLAQKGNALYNIVPDIISRLSDPGDTGVDEKLFRSIMTYLLQFIQKDKQVESLVGRLCHRYRATRTDRQWRDLSYCLSLLPYNLKTLKKLQENIQCFHDKLSNEEVYNCFCNIIAKSKKFAKVELKSFVEEFEATIKEYYNIGVDGDGDANLNKAAKALSIAASQRKKNDSVKTKRKTRQSNKKPWSDDDSGGEVSITETPYVERRRRNLRNSTKQ